MKRRRPFSCTCVLIGLAVVFGGWAITLWIAKDRSPRLVEIAQRVYNDPELFSTQDRYVWISNTTGVSLNEFPRPNLPFLFKAFRFDITTGQHREIKELAAALSAQRYGSVEIASDASFILTQIAKPQSKLSCMALAYDLSGHKLGEWYEKTTNLASPILQLRPMQWVETHEADRSTSWVTHRFSGSDLNLGLCPMPRYSSWLGQDTLGRILNFALDYDSNDERTYRFRSYDRQSLHVCNTWTLPIPAEADINLAELSPNGQRLLYMLQSGGESMYPPMMRWMFSYRGTSGAAPVRWSLWTSNVDGSSPHEIGCILSNEDPGGVIGVKWLPDSKTISFINHGWLHTAAAP